MKLHQFFVLVTASVSLLGCAGLATFDEYDTDRSPSARVAIDKGCFNVWKHPGGDDSLLVRECEGSEFAQALGEGVAIGLSLGLFRPDAGKGSKAFIRAAQAELDAGCHIFNAGRLDDGMGGTLGYEIVYVCEPAQALNTER